MMSGKLLRGRHNQAGCLGGHLAVNPHGRLCTCGAIGCAESEASSWALPAICTGWPGFPASRLADEEVLDFAALFRLADAGDDVAAEIKRHCIDVWAALAVSLVHAYDPELIVIGGGVMRSGDQIPSAIRQRVQQTAWTPWGKVQVEAAQCGENAALLGAIPLLSEVRQ
jgi:glucokinase